MSSTVKWDRASDLHALAVAGQVVASNATTAFDFGTPDDIYLPTVGSSAYKPGDTVLVVLSATRAAGTTSTLSYTIQDAPDSAGSIGTPATAVTAGTVPAFLAAGAGTKSAAIAVQVQPGRPWLRINVVHGGGGTDSFNVQCSVFGVRS